MASHQPRIELRLPQQLQERLVQFQRRVWSIKMAEAVLAGLAGLFLSYIAVFALDRVSDTPGWLRAVMLLVGCAAGAVLLPWNGYRWVWRSRRLTDVARIVSMRHPRVGDRLLGIVELTESHGDGHASASLCRAAIQQVADDTRDHDFLASVPNPRHRVWTRRASAAGLVAVLLACVPGAGWNAFQRWALPWKDIPRYTFAQLQTAPHQLYVPIGEPFTVELELDPASPWKPAQGRLRYERQTAVYGQYEDGRYVFQLPPQTTAGWLRVRVGDATCHIPVEPKTRPELLAMVADVKLPEYLQHPDQRKDIRGGVVTLLSGSLATFQATASREIANVVVEGTQKWMQHNRDIIRSHPVEVTEPATHLIRWTDVVGLSAKEPFQLTIRTVDDEAPTLQVGGLLHDKVLLDEEVLSFNVSSSDDFGVKQLGVEWTEIPDPVRNPKPDHGEYLLSSGGPQEQQMSVAASFSAKQLGITPQPIHLRVFVEDYLPGRQRVYSPQYRLFILNAEQHMIWVTEQMERWERQVWEVRDEEQRLHEQNKELAALPPDQLNDPNVRNKIAAQAAAERANARRLETLNDAGEQLIALATRNDEFNVATLEKWAEMLQALKNLASNRMPAVGTMLQDASQASAKPSAPSAVPQIIDQEPGMRRDDDPSQKEPSTAESQQPQPGGRLGLPTTTVSGPSGGGSSAPSPAADKLDEAVAEQAALLEEFNRVMEEISQLLQDLQGSTFVKRLKHASRQETQLASSLHEQLLESFGQPKSNLATPKQSVLEELRVKQSDTMRDVSLIQEDLQAYFQRTQRILFRQVHEEMKDTRVVSTFKSMSEAMAENQSGETIAEAEYWADQLDRWAEMLVGPGCKECGPCPGSKGDSLPPSIVLEVLRILHGEMDLRELTRAAEQARSGLEEEAYLDQVSQLEQTQRSLQTRTTAVITQLQELQESENRNFAQDLQRLNIAESAMSDASDILSEPDTGGRAIAAETEAIEALLATRRAGGGGGGGSGTVPGGSTSGGAAEDGPSALNGIATGMEAEARLVQQATGTADSGIPEEFRAGLDAYFSGLERQ